MRWTINHNQNGREKTPVIEILENRPSIFRTGNPPNLIACLELELCEKENCKLNPVTTLKYITSGPPPITNSEGVSCLLPFLFDIGFIKLKKNPYGTLSSMFPHTLEVQKTLKMIINLSESLQNILNVSIDNLVL